MGPLCRMKDQETIDEYPIKKEGINVHNLQYIQYASLAIGEVSEPQPIVKGANSAGNAYKAHVSRERDVRS
jgi:hypothetical protein